MSDNRNVLIRPMVPADIVDCIALSEAEGWNQTMKDWQILVERPQNSCLVAECDDRLVATATAMDYSNEVAWVGMVLVEKNYRGRGISKILLLSLLDQLGSCKSVRLDATPAGQPVYEKLGFKNEYVIYRMTNSSVSNADHQRSFKKSETIQLSDIPEISLLDHSAFGANRTYLLNSLLVQNSGIALCLKSHERITSFTLGRKGRKYLQIGPVVAPDLSEAINLISDSLAECYSIPVVMDVLSDKPELIQWLTSVGFSHQRQFFRMHLHQNLFPGNIKNNYLICGPEFG